MAITIPGTGVELAPGVATALSAPGAIPGASAAASITDVNGVVTAVPAVFTADSVTLTAVDGALSGTLTLTNGDNLSTASAQANLSPQYLDVNGFTGYGTTGLTVADMNAILRQASSYVDAVSSQGTFRYLGTTENHTWRSSRRIYPRRRPIRSVTSLYYQLNATMSTLFGVNDMIVVPDLGYIELLSWAVGTYAITTAIQTLGFAADIIKLTYIAGYKWGEYPANLREATAFVARKLIAERQVSDSGLAGFSAVRSGLTSYTIASGKSDELSGRVADMLRSLESPARFA